MRLLGTYLKLTQNCARPHDFVVFMSNCCGMMSCGGVCLLSVVACVVVCGPSRTRTTPQRQYKLFLAALSDAQSFPIVSRSSFHS